MLAAETSSTRKTHDHRSTSAARSTLTVVCERQLVDTFCSRHLRRQVAVQDLDVSARFDRLLQRHDHLLLLRQVGAFCQVLRQRPACNRGRCLMFSSRRIT